MADRPPRRDDIPDEPGFTGGWHQPQTPGLWRPVPPKESQPVQPQPALPQDVPATPEAPGAWHLPRPEDTSFTTESVLEVTAPAETEAIPEPETPVQRPDELALIEAALSGEKPAPAATAEPKVEIAAPEDMIEDSQSLLDLEQAAAETPTEPALAPLTEDDEAFSLSELMALQSLVEQPPKATIVPGQAPAPSPAPAEAAPPAASTPPPAAANAADTQSAEKTDTQPLTAADPGEYARRQLELLQQEEAAAPTTATGATAAQPPAATPTSAQEPAAEDPGEYARQRLEELLTTGAVSPVGSAAAQPQSAEDQELARRFRETEERVRGLRQQFRAGQISRDQLQAELRRLMILDRNQVWWMMGLETDNWYRFENNEWVLAQPPVSLSDAGRFTGGIAPATGGYTPTPASPGMAEYTPADEGVLPRLPTEQSNVPLSEYTQPSAAFRTPPPSVGGFGDDSQLPRNVPIQDPDRTVVGTVGAYPGMPRSYEAETVVGGGYAPETVVGTAYEGIPAPGPDEPDYDLDEAAPTAEEIQARAQRRLARNVLTGVVIFTVLGLLVVAGGLGFILMQHSNMVAKWQPQIDALANYEPDFQTVRVMDVNNDLIAELTSEQGGARTDIPLEKISPFMIHAIVSAENQRYFEDPGWDQWAIILAFLGNLGAGEVQSGASTITQQIAKQLVLRDSTVSLERKLEEFVVASKIAQQYTKNEVLELYLNEIYFGNQTYGVEAASQFYFGHSAEDLNLPEAALLTAMVSAPAAYDPVRHGQEDPSTYSARRETTLAQMRVIMNRMVEVGCLPIPGTEGFCVDQAAIRSAAAQQAAVEARNYRPRDVTFRYPHFVQFVQQLVERTYGPGEMYRRGFVIRTTLNPAVQNVAQTTLSNAVKQLANTNLTTGSIMVSDPRTGAIRAMVGSPDFNNDAIDGQVNTALTWQQPGSAIKPIVYAGALEGVTDANTGQRVYMTPATILWDVPTSFNGYTPVNFDGQFRGPVSFRAALQGSINVPSVKVYEFTSAAKFQDIAGRLGLRFRDDAQFGLATALGATEVSLYDMVAAYGTLANDGVRMPLYAVEAINDADGNVVQAPPRAEAAQAVSPQLAFLMQNILSDDTARAGSTFGEGGALTIEGLPRTNYVAAKTGTTNDARDLWTVGFTSNAVVGIWMGNQDDEPTYIQGSGYNIVTPIWNQVMQATLRTMPAPQPFTNPGGVVEIQICPLTGTLPPASCPALRNELFIPDLPPPPAEQAFVQQVSIDTWTGLRANQYCQENTISGTYLSVNDQTAVAWLNTAAGQAYLRQLGVTGGTLETVPAATCDLNTEIPVARITSPADGQTVTGPVQVTGSASASAATFSRYQLEVAPAGTNSFTIISGPTTTIQNSGVLGTWDSTRFPNGQYTLRLAMFANNGGYVYKTVTVLVNNIPPTPTPTPFVPTPFPTLGIPPTVPFSFTPLPFETVVVP